MKKLLVVLLALVLVFTMAACGGGAPPAVEPEVNEMPADLVAFIDEELAAIQAIGEDVSGEWGDMHEALMETVDGDVYDEAIYADLKAVLDEHRIASGAYYVYVMIPDENNDYHITVDGSAEPDDFMTNYGWEVQFDEAWAGDVATARSGWDDDVPCWSCFAPVYNSDGEVVCIVGMDMPCELLDDYPEWNRDRPEWNGIEE
ncbi:MAG: hypothetical protein RBS51_07630 [Anaerovoracaceae bacterium]|jgi:hypothetical protein|nr:hypothetical protein [Anaerovoracaceae bacterium]